MSVPENKDRSAWLSGKHKVRTKGPSRTVTQYSWKGAKETGNVFVSEMGAWTIRNVKLEEILLFNF